MKAAIAPEESPLATADLDSEARTAFAARLTRSNLRHLQWLAVATLVVIAGTALFDLIRPLPLSATIEIVNGSFAALSLINFALALWMQRNVAAAFWSQAFVVLCAAEMLACTNAYFFVVLPGYGLTSIYAVGVMFTAVLFRLTPRVLFPLLGVNHAVFLFTLARRQGDIRIIAPAATDYSAVVLVSALAGWLLYRAARENFLKERVITQRTAELHVRNRELARLHQLEFDEKIAARLAEEKARLEVLRYQLNPHFLFNALTSICAQLPPGLAGARATIERLTDFCEATLLRPPEDCHPTLAQEMKLLRAYLAIEQTRWGELLRIEVEVAPEAAEEPIPSLLLLPLVENALKYGRATQRGVLAVRVAARCETAGTVTIEIANTGDWAANDRDPTVPSLGIGLENLRQRLRRYYPGTHEFMTEARDGWVRVLLRLPARVPARLAETVA